jgi:hypothetical protein
MPLINKTHCALRTSRHINLCILTGVTLGSGQARKVAGAVSLAPPHRRQASIMTNTENIAVSCQSFLRVAPCLCRVSTVA